MTGLAMHTPALSRLADPRLFETIASAQPQKPPYLVFDGVAARTLRLATHQSKCRVSNMPCGRHFSPVSIATGLLG